MVPSSLLPDFGEVGHETFLLLLGPSPPGGGSWQLSLNVGMLNLKALAASLQALQRQVPLHLVQWLRDSVRDPVLFLPSTAILGVLVFYPHAEPSMLLQGLTEAGGSGVAMVERVSICCPWLLSENEIQNPSRLLIIFLVWVSGK